MSRLTLEQYQNIDYTVAFRKIEGGFEVWYPEFGIGTLSAWDENLDDALTELDRMRNVFIEYLLEENKPVPEPSDIDDELNYSGQFNLRIPSVLHAHLAKEAKANGISMNQYITHLISERHIQFSIDKKLSLISDAVEQR